MIFETNPDINQVYRNSHFLIIIIFVEDYFILPVLSASDQNIFVDFLLNCRPVLRLRERETSQEAMEKS